MRKASLYPQLIHVRSRGGGSSPRDRLHAQPETTGWLERSDLEDSEQLCLFLGSGVEGETMRAGWEPVWRETFWTLCFNIRLS